MGFEDRPRGLDRPVDVVGAAAAVLVDVDEPRNSDEIGGLDDVHREPVRPVVGLADGRGDFLVPADGDDPAALDQDGAPADFLVGRQDDAGPD